MDSSSPSVSTPASAGTGDGGDNCKTLSRNALYTPLRAYEQDQVDPNTYMTTLKNLPASLKESSLFSFMQRVGEDYHRNRVTGPDPKNNGSRPLTVSDMDDRLRQRAVTLVGGGVSSAMTTSKPKSPNAGTRKRPRREWKYVEPMLASSHRTRENVLDFLVSMNGRWNAYMLQVLDIDLDKNMYLSQPEEVHIQAIKAKFVVARDNIELVGAHVCIHSCKQKRQLVDIHGLMVGETKNTWAVAILSRSGRKKRRRKASEHEGKGDNVETPYVGNLNPTEIVIVPKDGSSLDLIIPLSVTSTKGGAPPSTDNSQDTSLQMFPIVHRSIYVRLSS